MIASVVFVAALSIAGTPSQPLSGQVILDRAFAVWLAQPKHEFEAFTMPCHELLARGAQGSCGASTAMRVYMRMADGVAHVETIPPVGQAPRVLLEQGHLFGPAFAPLGFTKKLGAPARVGSLSSEPFGDLKSIGSVTSVAAPGYDVAVSEDITSGVRQLHLKLTPRIDDGRHPLRDLVVRSDSYEVCSLTYAVHFQGALASVRYDFEQVGTPPTAVIARITARVPYRVLLGTSYTNVTEQLRDTEFPAKVPGFL